MKRIVSILLVFVCLISMASCAKTDGTVPGKDYKKALDMYCNYLVFDINDIRGFAPDEFWSTMKSEEGYDIDGEGAADKVSQYIEKNRKLLEEQVGGNIKITYKIVEDKYLNETSISNKKKLIEDAYGISPDRVKEVKRLTVEFTIKGADKEISNTVDMLPVNIDGKWYPCTTSGYFYVHPYVGEAIG